MHCFDSILLCENTLTSLYMRDTDHGWLEAKQLAIHFQQSTSTKSSIQWTIKVLDDTYLQQLNHPKQFLSTNAISSVWEKPWSCQIR